MSQSVNLAQSLQSRGSLEAWNNIVNDAFFDCSVDSENPAFDAELWRHRIDDITLIRIRAQPSRVSRWKQAVPRSSGSMLLHLQARGQSVNGQLGHQCLLEKGEATVCDPDRSYNVDFLTPYEMFVVEMPITSIVDKFPLFDPDRFVAHKVDAHRSQLLLSFLQTAWRQRDCLEADSDWRDCISRTSLDLAIRSISQTDRASGLVGHDDLRMRVLTHIRENLSEPDLRTSTIAEAVGVSVRSVQTVFERLATTTSGFILDKRLDIAAEALAGGLRGKTITELAFECGFSDSSYFSRCFRRRFGITPREHMRRGKAAN